MEAPAMDGRPGKQCTAGAVVGHGGHLLLLLQYFLRCTHWLVCLSARQRDVCGASSEGCARGSRERSNSQPNRSANRTAAHAEPRMNRRATTAARSNSGLTSSGARPAARG